MLQKLLDNEVDDYFAFYGRGQLSRILTAALVAAMSEIPLITRTCKIIIKRQGPCVCISAAKVYP